MSTNSAYNFTESSTYHQLQQLFQTFKAQYDHSAADSNQFLDNESDKYCFEALELYVDFSRHWMNDEIFTKLLDLAKESPLEEHIKSLFSGAIVNPTEKRPALHTALRANGSDALGLKNDTIHQNITNALAKMRSFCESVHNQTHLGYDGSIITDVVHIGIGGSHLGPQFVNEALQNFSHRKVNIHFWSAVDNYASSPHPILQQLKPQNTLFILASKSFTTQELIINAALAKKWFIDKGGDEKALDKHFIALTSNIEKAISFGISEENIFPMWDWVGGRYSVWSAIGLPVMLSIGYENFTKLLSGAFEMDNHFYHAPLHQNIPVLMAIIGIWYLNFCKADSSAVITYHSALEQLSPYLQQLDMESNGKSTDKNGNPVNYQTSPVIWGGSGIKGQHSYHQLLHQGTVCCPIDFIGVADEPNSTDENNFLLSNLLAQSYVLNKGKNVENQHQCLDGNRATSILLIKQITPQAIGRLLALYEHKVFVQGVIWNINSYDQWGVEEGKLIAKKWQHLFAEQSEVNNLDPTTGRAVAFIKKARQHS